MRHATHDEVAGQIIETVRVLENQAQLAHQHRVLEVVSKSRHKLGNENRIVWRKIVYEFRIDGEVAVLAMTGTASSSITVECFVEKTHPAAPDRLLERS